MKKSFAIFFLSFGLMTNATAQSDEKAVIDVVETFKKAMIEADKNRFEMIIGEELVYGHSSGKVQNKTEFIEEIISGQPFRYTEISLSDQTIKIAGNTAVVRHVFSAKTLHNGVPGDLKIGNMLIWQKQSGKWKLLARQAYKL